MSADPTARGAGAPPDRAATLSDRVAAARRAALVGRDAELARFGEVLEDTNAGPRVLWFHGVGGIGKSTLLDVCADRAAAAGWQVHRLDARGLRESPQVLAALVPALAPRSLLVLDTCEGLGALEQDLFDRHLPRAPEDLRVVLACRHPPRALGTGPGLARRAARARPRPAGRRVGADRALARGGFGPDRQARWLACTRGHPLALALAVGAGAQRDDGFAMPEEPDADYLTRLLERFLDGLPDATHRAALELCALARVTGEGLLQSALGDAAPALFAWLRGLSFIRSTRERVLPHDLVRELVTEDLRWRGIDGFRADVANCSISTARACAPRAMCRCSSTAPTRAASPHSIPASSIRGPTPASTSTPCAATTSMRPVC